MTGTTVPRQVAQDWQSAKGSDAIRIELALDFCLQPYSTSIQGFLLRFRQVPAQLLATAKCKQDATLQPKPRVSDVLESIINTIASKDFTLDVNGKVSVSVEARPSELTITLSKGDTVGVLRVLCSRTVYSSAVAGVTIFQDGGIWSQTWQM
jgi:hypothetical protein